MAIIPKYDKYQPRFEIFMERCGLRAGDEYKPHEYINWISRNVAEFKRSKGMKESSPLTDNLQDEFTEFLRDKL